MRKMDEMEREMTSISIKYSWLFGLVLLFISNAYNLIKTKALHWSFSIMLSMMIVYHLSYTFQQYKKGDKNVIYFFIVFVIALVILIVTGIVLIK